MAADEAVVGKNGDENTRIFQPVGRYFSETIKNKHIVTTKD